MKILFLIALSTIGLAFQAAGQQPSVREVRGSEAILPLTSEPPPKLIVEPPLPQPLAQGKVII